MAFWARSLSLCVNFSSKLPRQYSTKPMTMAEVVDDLYRKIGGQKLWRPSEFDRSELESILPKSQDELPPQKMSRSYGEAILPIGADELLRQKYLNHTGTVRVGRIMEDLDAFSVWLCYRHLLNPKQKPGMVSPFCIVTALVDKINLTKKQVEADRDVKFVGRVAWVGKSSLETVMRLCQQNESGEWQVVAQSNFVMVARDPLNRGSAVVNKVIPETEEEKALFREGDLNTERRKDESIHSLLKEPPTESEREEIHSLFLTTIDTQDESYESRQLSNGARWMEDTEVTTTILCHPEHRNRHNRIFGGFIMRKALELAFVCSCVFCQSSPLILYVDDIYFRRPVDIGDVMFVSSKVVYVEKQFMQVRVIADVLNPIKHERYTTNVFHFTFTVPENSAPLATVMPRTYSDAMLYLDGKRHFQVAMEQKRYYYEPDA